MYSNNIYELVDIPEEVKPLGYKWVYKRKKEIDGNVETFMVRFVVKDYTQKKGIDYEETFSLISIIKVYLYFLIHNKEYTQKEGINN